MSVNVFEGNVIILSFSGIDGWHKITVNKKYCFLALAI